jgi:serine/threonine protein kinase
MTTRDPRSRVPRAPTGPEPREPTQPLSIESLPDDRSSHPSLAVGTRDADVDRERTSLESPIARNRGPDPQRDRVVSRSSRATDRDDPDTHLGEVLGAYRLDELLGKGGMGYVYRAEHVKLGREVALKLLRADYSRRRDAVLRFFQEAKTVNRVRHRNIVDVTDFVELDDGTTFIIMELLRGQSLGKWARTGVDLPRALAVLVQICDGLGAAHAVGVIHRDLKPDNVIVVPTPDGAELVKLLDFGVAKLVNREDEDIGFQTAAGSVIGTPAYMSPEQAGGMAVDHRSDIYSLGAIMYELFCGQPMFRGRSFGEYVRKHLTEIPVLPRYTDGGAAIDPRLEALIMRSLAKDPNERYGHILELRDGLLHLLGNGYETGSGAMSGPLPQDAQLPAHVLPLPPGPVTTAPTPASGPYPDRYDSELPSAPPSVATSHASGHERRLTPWQIWVGGGVIAIVVGIVGAVWYASARDVERSSDPVVVTVPPAAEPVVAKPRPLLFELRFDSLPAASVFAEGHSAELCRTPCAYNVDPSDGGPSGRRTFVLHADGYRDRSVVVDLTSSQHDYAATLDQILPAAATGPEVAAPPGSPTSTQSDKSEPATSGPSKATTDHHKPKPHRGKSKAEPSDDATHATDSQPATSKPADKGTGKIDPSDTLDPFHHPPT